MGVLIFAPFPSPQSLKLWRTPLHLSISNLIHKCTSISIFLFLGIGVIRTSYTLRVESIRLLQPNITYYKCLVLEKKFIQCLSRSLIRHSNSREYPYQLSARVFLVVLVLG